MASFLIGAGALFAAGTAARLTARSMARQGKVLSPFMAALAGEKASDSQWVKGGFQSRMDRKEAVQILGLKYVQSRSVQFLPLASIPGYPPASCAAGGSLTLVLFNSGSRT